MVGLFTDLQHLHLPAFWSLFTPNGLACIQIGALLMETLLLLGCAALLHPGNQVVLRWGKSPTILNQVIVKVALFDSMFFHMLWSLLLRQYPLFNISSLILHSGQRRKCIDVTLQKFSLNR